MNRVLPVSVVLACFVSAQSLWATQPGFHLQAYRPLSTKSTIQEISERHHSCSILP